MFVNKILRHCHSWLARQYMYQFRDLDFPHSGESRDFRILKKADSCENPSIEVRLTLIFPLILIRLAWGLKQIPRQNESNMSNRQRSG